MISKKISIFFKYLIVLTLIFQSNSQSQNIKVYPINKTITHYCSDNAYYFEFKISLSSHLNKIIPFEMEIPSMNRLPVKCVLDGIKSKVLCFHSFSNFVWSLGQNSRVELPYLFPQLEGIIWDYDSFLRIIYRNLWRTEGNCGLEFENLEKEKNQDIYDEIKKEENLIVEKKNEIIGNIEEIYNGKCNSSQYDYNFEMRMKLNEGEIVEDLKNAKNSKKDMKITFLHEIYVPILLGEKKQKDITNFKKNIDYKYVKCKYDSEINQNNFDSADGLLFQCNLKIKKHVKFQGPIQIKPFTDYSYATLTNKDGSITTKFIGIQFEIFSTSNTGKSDEIENKGEEEKPEPSNVAPNKSANLKLRNLGIEGNIKKEEPNFLILDSNLNIYICPDKPIFTVKNYDEGISFGGINTSGSKFLFIISGFLSNGYEYINDTLTYLDMTKDEIKFHLKVTDNLESPDLKKKIVKCTIPSGTSINKHSLIEINCIGKRAKVGYNNTDLMLNWNLQENNNFDEIMINWPYDQTHKNKKHIFFYNIEGLSVNKEDCGCFENKYYFYLYVYDLKSEPKISFNLPLVKPSGTKAECKLYNSVTFKCAIDLRLQKISKGSKIVLNNDISKYLFNSEQNIVLYHVNNETSSEIDFSFTTGETCGNIAVVGALKDVGYSYVQVILIIIGCIAGLAIIIFGICFCIIYEITHRNRKGPYFRYTEEKQIPNTSVSQTQPQPQ